MSETPEQTTAEPVVQSPPPMPAPAREPSDPRAELSALSESLKHKADRGTLSKFLRLRRRLRG